MIHLTEPDGTHLVSNSIPEGFTGVAHAHWHEDPTLANKVHIVENGRILHSGHFYSRAYLHGEALGVIMSMDDFYPASQVLNTLWKCEYCGEFREGPMMECPECGAPRRTRYGKWLQGVYQNTEIYLA